MQISEESMDTLKKTEESMVLDIKVISSELIKPSSPTPADHQTYTLCFFDQVSHPIQSYALLGYTNYKNVSTTTNGTNGTTNGTNVEPPSDIDAIISNLKACLSETLTHFYPMAGRCENESIVSCNDEGVQFNVAHVASDASALLSSPHRLSLYPKLYAREGNAHLFEGPQPISDLIPLAFQVNVFQCGGIVIGCSSLHKLMDLAAWASFLKYWATLANKNRKKEDLVEPDFEAAAKAFPPSPKVDRMLTVRSLDEMFRAFKKVNLVAKSFIVDKNAISELRIKAASEKLDKPTRFEALAAFVWEHALAAAIGSGALDTQNDKQVKNTHVTIFADLRARTSPPLPRATIGNLITQATARAEQIKVTMQDLAIEVHAAVLTLKTKNESTAGESGTEALMAERDAGTTDMIYKPGSYKLSSWSMLGLSEVDFGFGKPRVIPTDGIIFPVQRNFIYFAEHHAEEGDGFEVWLFLEEKEMQCLESDPQFLAFAVPS